MKYLLQRPLYEVLIFEQVRLTEQGWDLTFCWTHPCRRSAGQPTNSTSTSVFCTRTPRCQRESLPGLHQDLEVGAYVHLFKVQFTMPNMVEQQIYGYYVAAQDEQIWPPSNSCCFDQKTALRHFLKMKSRSGACKYQLMRVLVIVDEDYKVIGRLSGTAIAVSA